MTRHLTRRQTLALCSTALAAPLAVGTALADGPDSVFVWRGSGARFGGYSAIELDADRLGFLALSDRGFITRGRLSRAETGQITGVETLGHFPLRDTQGHPLRGRWADSEGLDRTPSGQLFVSFEGRRQGRVMRFTNPQSAGRDMPRHRGWRNLHPNSGLEALARDANGTLFAIPESLVDGGFPLYQKVQENWRIAAILPSENGFFPVGADFGPDGNLYLLERKFRLAFFASRISRITPGMWEHPERLITTRYGALDNHEGICVTADPRGDLWATTISDDNQNRFQRTEIAEFRLS